MEVKAINLSVVLDAIRHYGPISRTELAEMTELTSATITNVTSHLTDLGLISESGSAASHGGRKRVLLTLRENAYWAMGIEISRNHVSGVLSNLGGMILERAHEEIERTEGPQKTIDRVIAMGKRFLKRARESGRAVIGLGIGVPGPVNSEEGIVISPPNFPGWSWIRLRDRVEEELDLPVYIDDDAKTAALGEAWFGAGRGVDSIVYISVGTGIGAGVIVNGHLYRGTHELAGQIGHMTLDVNGPRCECSNVGCLEVLAAVPALLNAAASRLQAGEPSALQPLFEQDQLTMDEVCRQAEKGDPLAVSVMDQASRYLGAGVVNAVNLYDPEMIILGGRLVRSYKTLVDQVRGIVRERSFSFAADSVTIVPSALQGDSSAVGGVTLALEQFFGDPMGSLEPLLAQY